MPLFRIQHLTTYKYDRLIQESMNEIKIFPLESEEQELVNQDLEISGHPEVHLFTDYWGNTTGNFNLLAPHEELVINSRLAVRTKGPDELRINFLATFLELTEEGPGDIRKMVLSRPDAMVLQSLIEDMAGQLRSAESSVALTIKNCSDYIFEQFDYIKGITTTETTVDEILAKRAGVCQDFAHLLLQILRTMKIPSRYVSGYICPHRSGLRGEGATHAWVEAWIPGSGWTGIDPTNNIWVTNTHIKLAVGKDFTDCSPVKGTFKGLARQTLTVFVSVDYEDGEVVEVLNDVKMSNENTAPAPARAPSAGQQQ